MEHRHPAGKDFGNRILGLILLIAGTAWLLKHLEIELFPDWLISLPTAIIVLGLLFAFKTRFQRPGPILMMIVGTVWMLRRYADIPREFNLYLWPSALILFGIYLIFRPARRRTHGHHEYRKNWGEETSNKDRLDIDAIFCGSRKRIISKNFEGGEITAIFGGTELNLSQADFEKEITIDVSIVFGGLKIIIPNNWELKTQLTTIAAGVEDQRHTDGLHVVPEKTLVLKGTVVFGGIDIQNH